MQYCKNIRKEEVMNPDENQRKDDLNTGKIDLGLKDWMTKNGYLGDIGIKLDLPKRIAWTEYTEDSIIWHHSTEDEYRECQNKRSLGVRNG